MTVFGLEESTDGECVVLRLSGELDVSTAPTLRDAVAHLISEGRTKLVFDCSMLDFVDSTGLGVFIGARARALAAHGSVSLLGVRPALQRLLAVTGIESLFASAEAA